MPRPDFSRVPSFYHNYLNQVKEDDLMTALKNNTASFLSFLKSIPPEKHDYRYAHGKWTVKEVVQHVIDSERVFSYRALCFARKDTSSLPGFDENIFAANSKAEKRIWNDLNEEFAAVRKTTEILFNSFDKEQLESEGISNKYSNYVMGWGFICAGHCNHHQQVIRERYL
jgi:hypothetical protein